MKTAVIWLNHCAYFPRIKHRATLKEWNVFNQHGELILHTLLYLINAKEIFSSQTWTDGLST